VAVIEWDGFFVQYGCHNDRFFSCWERRIPMPYVHFTDEQIYRANAVDLVQFLQHQGEKLIPSGRNKRLASDHSITVRGNVWYDYAERRGGLAIDFVQSFYSLSFPEAVTRLLGGETGRVYGQAEKEPEKEPKPFALPPAHADMKRVFAYLIKNRLLGRDIISCFVREKLIYESCERIKNKQGEWKEYHNVVFVGHDENGIARHAHKRGLSTTGGYKGSIESSDPAYSFHRIGIGNRLYVFEAPVDLLSFISLYPEDWQSRSYVALCGTAEYALLKMLEANPQIDTVVFCLDHDEAGIEAAGRLAEILKEEGHDCGTEYLWPENKDWNEDIKARRGLAPIPAEEHPQITVCVPVFVRIEKLFSKLPETTIPETRFSDQLQRFKIHLHWGRFEEALGCMEDMAALSLFAAAREYRQIGSILSSGELSAMLQQSFKPHQNRGNIQNRADELTLGLQVALSLKQAEGPRSQEQMQKQADAWMNLALGCAKVVICQRAHELKQELKQKQEQKQKQNEQQGIGMS
jgi:hypothetical protein